MLQYSTLSHTEIINDMEDEYGYEMPRDIRAVSCKLTLYSRAKRNGRKDMKNEFYCGKRILIADFSHNTE